MSSLAQLLLERTDRQLNRLAGHSGVSRDRLEELSRAAEPSISEVRRIAGALGLPVEDLLPGNDIEAATELLFRRSMADDAKLPASAGRMARRVASSFSLGTREKRKGELEWRAAFVAPENNIGNAELNAAIFRSVFCGGDQLSPISNLPSIVSKNAGIYLYVINTPDLDGASALVDGSAFAFVAARFSGRMLFTLAHEVGHLVAHHDEESFAIIDEDVEAAPKGQNREKEAYANAFASALLMPRQSVGISLKTIRRAGNYSADDIGDTEINYLARIYGVSFWAAARRCEDLELLPRGGAFALNQRLVEEYGSAEQRADQLGLPPRAEVHFPKVPWPLVEAALENIRSGVMSAGKAASVLGISLAEIYSANAPTRH